METTYSTMGLHLCYRLWIADLNADVNILRIFDDYLGELKAKSETDVRDGVDGFQKKFKDFRNDIDQLTHDMHLVKMDLAAKAKEGVQKKENPADGIHGILRKRYDEFRVSFDKAKNEFVQFENQWLQ